MVKVSILVSAYKSENVIGGTLKHLTEKKQNRGGNFGKYFIMDMEKI